MKKIKFPKNFLWGTATSSHQIEGGLKNDWSEWEKSSKRISELKAIGKNPLDFISGKACNSYELYKNDIECMNKLNTKAYRFSIEWSRIEPSEGEFSEEAINHYKEQILELRKNNIEPFVTIYHWPDPVWLEEKKSWLNSDISFYFTRYAEFLVKNLGEYVIFWITINEPLVYASHSYLKGDWPPQKKSLVVYLRVLKNLSVAHRSAYKKIKEISPKAQVGIAKHNIYFEAYKNRVWNKILKYFSDWWWESFFLRSIKKYQDYIGLNYYTKNKIKYAKFNQNDSKRVNDLGWEIYPKGIYYELIDLKKYKKPIYITENGLADSKDNLRKDFIRDHLKYIHKAMDKGVDVRGYFHWSLLDNFEWAYGWAPKFGLYSVDRKTFKRTQKESAKYYAEICKNNYIE